MEKLIGIALVGIFGYLVTGLVGCAGGEVYLGTRRIDEYQASQQTHDKPYKCLFVDCNNYGGSK